jgi:hypothetical protein
VLASDVADEFHDDDGLADASAAVGAHLPAPGEGADEVHDLEACLQHRGRRLLIIHGGRRTVDGPVICGLNIAQVVDGLPQHIEQAPHGARPYRHLDGAAQVDRLGTATEAIGTTHGQAAHPVVAQVLLHLSQQLAAVHGYLDSVIDRRQLIHRELPIHHSAHNLDYLSFCHDITVP